MIRLPLLLHALLLATLLAPRLHAEPRLSQITRTADSVTLAWEGGHGPFVIETSPDLARWSAQGDPVTGRTATLRAVGQRAFHRVLDLDPGGVNGTLFGLLQTEQGEFGKLMGRHRLKTRLWLHRLAGPPHNAPGATPAEYWRKLRVSLQTHEEGLIRTWSGPLETLGLVTTPSSRQLSVAWTRGSGAEERRFLLTLDFPYPVNSPRTQPLLPSDPTFTLRCDYTTPQPELDEAAFTLTTTRTDTIGLVQMDPANPTEGWTLRKYRVGERGVLVDLHFLEGWPLREGAPPWILKTLLLDRWLSPAVARGGSLPPFTTDNYFALTLLPGHHNFYETVLIEPALDASVPTETRAALAAANIRFVYTLKDLAGVSIGGDAELIRYIGFDGTVRTP